MDCKVLPPGHKQCIFRFRNTAVPAPFAFSRHLKFGKHTDLQVNRRLESLEKNSGDGDPAFPKLQWPPSELCPLCRLPSLQRKSDVTWNEEEVYRSEPTLTLSERINYCVHAS